MRVRKDVRRDLGKKRRRTAQKLKSAKKRWLRKHELMREKVEQQSNYLVLA